jgi:ketosteroid isomerase-like protein
LASRARRRVQGASTVPKTSLTEQRQVVDAFLGALRRGDFEGLVAVLDPDVVVRIDEAAVPSARSREIRGARNWAKGAIAFSRQLRGTVQPMLVNGDVGLVWTPGEHIFRALRFTFADGKIATVDIVADPAGLRELDLAMLETSI